MKPRGLPPQARMSRAADFDRARRDGRFKPGPLIGVAVYRHGGGPTRLGLAISRKVGGAVVRNRLRRRLREVFRAERSRLQPGWDIVIVPRRQAAGAGFAALRADLLSALERAGLLAERTEDHEL